MKIIYGINKIREFKRPVVAMGVFDGVHRGHREVLMAAVKKAREIKGTSVALTFWPHPQKQESLYSLEHRLRLISELGVDASVIINFTGNFAKIAARDFVKDIFAGRFKAKYIYVGRNFRFGNGARGNLALLKKLGAVFGFKARGFNIIKVCGHPISSSSIRSLIKKGKIAEAQNSLARPVSILGTVVKGTRIGRILGFPTANIKAHHEIIPASGIYAVRAILDNKIYKGACYIGSKPTFANKNKKRNIEVHLFNFQKNIYGKSLEILFVKMIRKDKKFPTPALLTKQIKKDVSAAQKILS